MPVWCKTHPTVQHHIDIKFVGRRLHRGGMGWWGAMDPSPWQPGPGEGSALGADMEASMEDFTGVAMMVATLVTLAAGVQVTCKPLSLWCWPRDCLTVGQCRSPAPPPTGHSLRLLTSEIAQGHCSNHSLKPRAGSNSTALPCQPLRDSLPAGKNRRMAWIDHSHTHCACSGMC